jgi:glycosyltransferase involved in cell wall biosynthesis
MNNPAPKILAILPGFIPSTMICVVNPFLRLHRAGFIQTKITLEEIVTPKELRWADLVVFCRNTEPRFSLTVDFLERNQTPFIYDLDDNFFEIPGGSIIGEYHRDPARLAMVCRYMQGANLVRVYSRLLWERARAMNSKVERMMAPIDLGLIRLSAEKKPGDKIKIVFATSRYDDELVEIFIPALKKVLTQYRNHLEVHLWGTRTELMNGDEEVIFHRLILDYGRFLRRFSQEGYDIGLAPLKNDSFHLSKTNNKFREYGACKIAGIYSDVEVYSDCVVDGETGLLVGNDTDAWLQAMIRLIDDEQLRRGIQNKAREFVRSEYTPEMFERLWLRQFQQVLERARHEIRRFDGESLRLYPRKNSSRIHFSLLPVKERMQKVFRHLQRSGAKRTSSLLQQFLYGRWMVFKIRFQLRFGR